MLPIPTAAFEAHLLVDYLRVALTVGGVLFIMLALKVVWLRIRRDRPPRWSLAFAWAALAAAAFLATAVSIRTLGTPPDWTIGGRALFLTFGFVSLSLDVAWLPWQRGVKQD